MVAGNVRTHPVHPPTCPTLTHPTLHGWPHLSLSHTHTPCTSSAPVGVAIAARLSGGAQPLSSKSLPPSLDVMGWCTWDAFYSTVSARGIQVRTHMDLYM